MKKLIIALTTALSLQAFATIPAGDVVYESFTPKQFLSNSQTYLKNNPSDETAAMFVRQTKELCLGYVTNSEALITAVVLNGIELSKQQAADVAWIADYLLEKGISQAQYRKVMFYGHALAAENLGESLALYQENLGGCRAVLRDHTNYEDAIREAQSALQQHKVSNI